MSFTLDTFHFETEPMNAGANEKIKDMLLTLDTSHSPIGPCGPVEQSPFGDNFRHASMALLSSDFDCGEKTAVGRGLLSSGFDFVEKIAVGRGEVGLAEGKTVNVPVHSFRNIDPPEPVNISILLAFEFTQTTRQSCCLNDVAFQNM